MSDLRKKWGWEILPTTNDWSWNIKELSSYRHLLMSLVKREFLLYYQQTILGPIWVLFQPLITLLTYVIVFKKLIGVSIGTLPPVLFYFSGILLWNFFMESFDRTSNTFRDNIHLFSKVYFPRLIMPLSILSTNFLRCLIQLGLLLLIILYYTLFKDYSVQLKWIRLAFPFAIILTGVLSLSLGLLFSILTAKYRDIGNFVGICMRLLMFITPVIYPLASIHHNFRWIVQINPLTSFFELFRLSLLGEGTVDLLHLIYSITVTVIAASTALILFNKKSSQLIDFV
jgi:lipopolysaccharide transport system permease protein